MTLHQPGDFQLVPVGGATGIGIRVGQWLNGNGFENFEHARVYIGPSEVQGQGWFVQAEPHGAELALGTLGNPNYHTAWSSGLIPLTTAQRASIVGWAKKYIGTPYGFLDYAALAAHRLDLPLPWLKTYIASDKTMICSQLVAKCYADAGVNLFPDEWPGYVTPGALYQLLVSKGLHSWQ